MGRNFRQGPFAKSVHNKPTTLNSPFTEAGNDIVMNNSSIDQQKFLPGLQKQKVLNKFFEVATMQEPEVAGGSGRNNFDSSKVTAAIVNQVAKEHQILQDQL